MKTTSSLKKSSLALGLLALCLTRAGAQTSSGTQIIGYNNNDQDLSDITDLANSPYTTFIDGFLQPTSSSTATNPNLVFDTQSNSTLAANKVTAFNTVENAGKNVLLSFGGELYDPNSTLYKTFATGATGSYTAAQATQNLANVLAAYVTGASSYTNAITGASVPITTYDHSAGTFKGFNGIDLDFEDSQSFTSAQTYNGVQFVSQLTIDLRNQLGAKYLITQAPQPPYLDPAYTQNGGYFSANNGAAVGGYQAILTGPDGKASAAGNATSWLNVQLYNNHGDDGSNSDGTANVNAAAVAFENLVTANPGISASKFVLTLPINQADANDNYFTSAQITALVSQINSWLQSHGDGSIAGIAGFQLYNGALAGNQSQMDANNLAFANAFLAGDVPEPSTWALVACGVGLVGWTLRRRYAVRG